ncbi:hypothetical protein BsWGS_18226 [Bradybaena similaris]
MSEKMSIETVYGTTNEESHVMSEKVQTLAGTVYKEFEKVIKRYDEDVVKDLMPLVVGILETLDAAFTEKQELDVEIELLREDNEQLLTQYEREKQLRKSAEQKFLEMEDNIEGVRKELEDKVETLESILRMSEIKSKNSADHVSRLEEKEQEGKNEYNKLHERYTELFRTHMDYMERTKILMGTDKLSDLTGMSPRITKGGFSLPGLRPVSVAYGGIMEFQRHESSPMSFDTSTPQSSHSVSLKSELEAQTPKKGEISDEKEQLNNSVSVTEKATTTKQPKALPTPTRTHLPETKPSKTKSKDTQVPSESSVGTYNSSQKVEATGSTPEESNVEAAPTVVLRKKKDNSEEDYTFDSNLSFEDYSLSGLNQTLAAIIATTPELEESHDSLGSPGSLCKRKSVRNDNSIFDELQSTDIAEVDFGADITDSDKEDEEEAEESKENDRDSVGDNFFGMGKELDNLIMENTELLATKNALNIVKDDLIAKVDELSSEQEILREEIASLQAVRAKLQQRLTAMEEELKRVKEENEKRDKEQTEKGEEEEDVPMAQRKRFTRVEMARVLMERNQYKERLMELQEAVRWTEMIRASREHPGELQTKKKSSVWNFFSELVAPSQAAPAPSTPAHKQIAEKHQSILQAVTAPSHHHLPPPSDFDIPLPATSVSLLPSPTARSLSSLARVTILPPHEAATLSAPEPVPMPVVLPASLLNLPPTPSGDPPITILPVSLPLSVNPSTTLPSAAALSTAVNFTTSAAPSPVNLVHSNQQPLIPKSSAFNLHRPTSALPGIRLEPDHPIHHL